MTTNPAMISTPTLVLTIGSGLVPAAADVQRIFFQSDVRRRATTRFLGLDFRAKQPELTEVAVTVPAAAVIMAKMLMAMAIVVTIVTAMVAVAVMLNGTSPCCKDC